MVPHHHVVLNHAEPLWLRIPARTRRILLALQRRSLLDVGDRRRCNPVSSLFQRANRIDRSVWTSGAAEDPRQLHDERGTGAVIVGGLAPAMAIHMRADDVHLVGTRRANLRAIHLFARAGGRRLRVELARSSGRVARSGLVFTPVGLVMPRYREPPWPPRISPLAITGLGDDGSECPGAVAVRGGAGLYVYLTRSVCAAEALELRLNPVDSRAVAVGALPAIAELGQALDGRLVLLQVEPADQRLHRLVGWTQLHRRDRRRSGDLGDL